MSDVTRGNDFIPVATVTSASKAGDPVYLGACVHRFSLQLDVISTDAAGSVTVEVSNDRTNWNALTFEDGSTSITVAGDTHAIRDCETYALYARAKYTRVSGTNGTIQAIGHLKKNY
jgi:L-ascorbate metabolism protein UlaG (beta-lactamase superfamily)